MLYVGKAKNLKNRLKSYQGKNLLPRPQKMVSQAVYLQWRVLESELEALLVEAELVRSYQPAFNVLLKDDKSPLYIIITAENFPRVLRGRKTEIDKWSKQGKKIRVFGPFTSAYKVNEILKIARPVFPWCNAKRVKNIRPCLESHLGLCSGFCTGQVKYQEYQQMINNLTLFLRGQTKMVERRLRLALKKRVAQEEFEAAAKLRDQLKVLQEITQSHYRLQPELFLPNLSALQWENATAQLRAILRESWSLPRTYQFGRIEAYDVSNTSGQQAVVSMVVFTEGKSERSVYRLFNIKTLTEPNDPAMLKEALSRRVNHQEWPWPELIVIDGGKGQVRRVLEVWREKELPIVPLIGLAKKPDRIVLPQIVSWKPRLKIQWQMVLLKSSEPALRLLQQLRDEAHRFGKKHHLLRREKNLLEA